MTPSKRAQTAKVKKDRRGKSDLRVIFNPPHSDFSFFVLKGIETNIPAKTHQPAIEKPRVIFCMSIIFPVNFLFFIWVAFLLRKKPGLSEFRLSPPIFCSGYAWLRRRKTSLRAPTAPATETSEKKPSPVRVQSLV